MKKYVILTAADYDTFGMERQVKEYLDSGWSPCGGVARGNVRIYQAMLFDDNEGCSDDKARTHR